MASQAEQQQREQLVAVLAAYAAQTGQLRGNLVGYIRRLWASLGSYRDADMRKFVRQVVPVVAGAQRSMASLTAANLARQRQISLGGASAPVGLDMTRLTGPAVRNGADPDEVYGRPFHLVWRKLDELPRVPGSVDKAISEGLKRAEKLAATDVQLAKQHAALQILGHDDKVVGYRRFLEGAYSCAKCIVASTLRYHKRDLLPIHPGCDCGVVAIWGRSDPGLTIESMVNVGTAEQPKLVHVADLPDVHDRIEATFGRSSSGARTFGVKGSAGKLISYRDALVVHQNGELGPVLAVRGQSFTGPSDIAKHVTPRRAAS